MTKVKHHAERTPEDNARDLAHYLREASPEVLVLAMQMLPAHRRDTIAVAIRGQTRPLAQRILAEVDEMDPGDARVVIDLLGRVGAIDAAEHFRRFMVRPTAGKLKPKKPTAFTDIEAKS